MAWFTGGLTLTRLLVSILGLFWFFHDSVQNQWITLSQLCRLYYRDVYLKNEFVNCILELESMVLFELKQTHGNIGLDTLMQVLIYKAMDCVKFTANRSLKCTMWAKVILISTSLLMNKFTKAFVVFHEKKNCKKKLNNCFKWSILKVTLFLNR